MQGASHGALGAETSLVGGAAIEKLKRLNHSLEKAAAPIDISRSHLIAYPATIRGQHHDPHGEVPPYHVTVRWLGNNPKRSLQDTHQKIASFEHRELRDFEVVPHHFDTARGRIHVLLLRGADLMIHQIHHALKGHAESEPQHEFVPHITVSQKLHDEVKEKALTAKDLGIKLHALEYRVGTDVVRRYERPTPSDYPEMQAAVKKSDLETIGDKLRLLRSRV